MFCPFVANGGQSTTVGIVINEEIKSRFERKAVRGENCWDWVGSKDVYGYGYVSYFFKKLKAHRVSYEIYKGEIPQGLVLDHLCRNRSCVNPDHVEPVTIGENVRRGYHLGDECLHGHKMTTENTGLRKAYGKTYPFCKECRKRTKRKKRS